MAEKKDILLQQAEVLVEEHLKNFINIPAGKGMLREKRVDFFGRTNDLKRDLMRIKSYVGETAHSHKVETLLSKLPKGEGADEKYAHEQWTTHMLWMWSTLAKNCPSTVLARQMARKKEIFFRHATSSEKQEFERIFSTLKF